MMQGKPISEAPRDGTIIIASVMRISGVPDTGHSSFERLSYRFPDGGFDGWHPVGQDWMTFGESTILAWWPDGTPEDQMETRPRTNFKWQPSNGCGGDAFYNEFCENCVFEQDHIADENQPGGEILSRSFAYGIGDPEYPEEWTDRDGHPRCTKFTRVTEHFAGDSPPPRCARYVFTERRNGAMNNAQATKTHCPHGHLYGGDNLILMVVRDYDGNDTGKRKRQCRQCKRDSRKPKPVPVASEAVRASSEA